MQNFGTTKDKEKELNNKKIINKKKVLEAIRLTGMFGLMGIIFIVSGLHFEKSPYLFGTLLVIFSILTIIIIFVEFHFRKIKYNALRRQGDFKDD